MNELAIHRTLRDGQYPSLVFTINGQRTGGGAHREGLVQPPPNGANSARRPLCYAAGTPSDPAWAGQCFSSWARMRRLSSSAAAAGWGCEGDVCACERQVEKGDKAQAPLGCAAGLTQLLQALGKALGRGSSGRLAAGLRLGSQLPHPLPLPLAVRCHRLQAGGEGGQVGSHSWPGKARK